MNERTGPVPPSNRAIAYWLLAVCGFVFLMVVVGGATRLTDSGLSITEWRPVTGAIPPLSAEDWHEEFSKYRQIPEYHQVNRGMSLDEFKTIYWWEWGHRLLGRLIGFVFLVPFVFFWWRGMIERELVPRLLLMFVLGGLQGALGWYMVMSGLSERVDVSQYRLTAHLGLAVLIFGLIFWTALELLRPGGASPAMRGRSMWIWAAMIAGLVYFQILLGGFVAGLDAGFVYNTWPLMDGRFVPAGYWFESPWYLNWFENRAAVQFNHRTFAYIIVAIVGIHALLVWRSHAPAMLRRTAGLLVAAVLLQVVLGIWTLLAWVPISLGVVHQGGALIVLMAALFHAFETRRHLAGSSA